MSDCVESGRGNDSRGLGAVKAQPVVDGTNHIALVAARIAAREQAWIVWLVWVLVTYDVES